jgi:hypothetical protein
MKRIALLAVAAAVLTSTASVRAEETAETDAIKRYPPSSVRPKLIAGGLTLTGLAWGAAFLSASTWPEVPGSDELKIPVVGPWMALAKNGCAPDDPDCGFTLYLRAILTIADGLVQLGGLGIAGEGIFMTTEAAPAPERKTGAKVTIRPVPLVSGSTTGFGVVGTF